MSEDAKQTRAEYFRTWRKLNPQKMIEQNRRWNSTHPNQRKEINLKWRAENPDKVREMGLERNQRWRDNNREAVRQSVKIRSRLYRSTPKGSVDGRISRGIRLSLGSNKRGMKWESLVGYTTDDLMRHLETQFTGGMGWNNMARWHIDHIVPKSHFTYETGEDPEFKRAWALDNLQPLWAEDNLRKSKKLPEINQGF